LQSVAGIIHRLQVLLGELEVEQSCYGADLSSLETTECEPVPSISKANGVVEAIGPFPYHAIQPTANPTLSST
jgi:hypothetical protein